MSLQKLVFLPGRLGGGKVLTSTQLKKRGFHLASKCPFCGREGGRRAGALADPLSINLGIVD